MTPATDLLSSETWSIRCYRRKRTFQSCFTRLHVCRLTQRSGLGVETSGGGSSDLQVSVFSLMAAGMRVTFFLVKCSLSFSSPSVTVVNYLHAQVHFLSVPACFFLFFHPPLFSPQLMSFKYKPDSGSSAFESFCGLLTHSVFLFTDFQLLLIAVYYGSFIISSVSSLYCAAPGALWAVLWVFIWV